MRRSRACIIAGVILGMSLLSCTIPTDAKEIIPERQDPVLEISIDDAQLLMRTAWAEAGNQGEDGMWLVMSVIMNRVNDSDWPDNVHDVVYQQSQFATPAKLSDVETEAHLALARLETGSICPGIIAFETIKSNKLDRYFDQVFEYKDHQFYAKKVNKK